MRKLGKVQIIKLIAILLALTSGLWLAASLYKDPYPDISVFFTLLLWVPAFVILGIFLAVLAWKRPTIGGLIYLFTGYILFIMFENLYLYAAVSHVIAAGLLLFVRRIQKLEDRA